MISKNTIWGLNFQDCNLGFHSHAAKNINICSVRVIFIRFGSRLHRQIVRIPMGTNCAYLVAALFLFCYERDFIMFLSDDAQTNITEAFKDGKRKVQGVPQSQTAALPRPNRMRTPTTPNKHKSHKPQGLTV